MVEQIIKYVVGEMRVIAQAPVTFFAAVGVMSVVIWKLLSWRHAPKDDLISLYKARLDGATPDEAKARIETLEATIARSIGSRWEPLTDREITALAEALSQWRGPRPTRTLILYKDNLGKDVALSAAAAFERAGFPAVARVGPAEDGLTVGPFPAASAQVQAALEETTKLRVRRIAQTTLSGADPSARPGSHDYNIIIRFGTNVAT